MWLEEGRVLCVWKGGVWLIAQWGGVGCLCSTHRWGDVVLSYIYRRGGTLGSLCSQGHGREFLSVHPHHMQFPDLQPS